MQTLEGFEALKFDNKFTRELPADPETRNFLRQVSGACFSRVTPAKVSKPKLIAWAREVAEDLGLNEEHWSSQTFAEIFSGNQQLPGMDTYANCYGGHQFGNWAGQLGDGRAINLGEVIDRHGQRQMLQLKGAGPTPYSRRADGLAVLRSSVREFLCSEAMYHLGIPTTRALSLVLTGDLVVRDMFYDGNPQPEPGAIVCRVSPSFTRFGSFQIFASRDEIEPLKALVDYTIRTDFPHLGESSETTYVAWYREVVERTMEMVLHWDRVGFVHGVMNTDNMSVLGLTIDYGPYGWLEGYDPTWTPNTTDAQYGRYSFGNQPQIAMWNLVQFARALLPLISKPEPLQEIIDHHQKAWKMDRALMRSQKLGLLDFDPEQDQELIDELFKILRLVETDMTLFFRYLATLDVSTEALESTSDENLMAPLMDAYYNSDKMTAGHRMRTAQWLRTYLSRANQNGSVAERKARMNSVNPKYVMRNYLAQNAIDEAEQGNFDLIQELLEIMRHPYDEQPDKEHFAAKRPEWARHKPGCSMLSCSS